jgi:hypothetical protein
VVIKPRFTEAYDFSGRVAKVFVPGKEVLGLRVEQRAG